MTGYTKLPEVWEVLAAEVWASLESHPGFTDRVAAGLAQLDAGQKVLFESDPPELPDADITPDEAEPLPPDEPVKTDPIPEETE